MKRTGAGGKMLVKAVSPREFHPDWPGIPIKWVSRAEVARLYGEGQAKRSQADVRRFKALLADALGRVFVRHAAALYAQGKRGAPLALDQHQSRDYGEALLGTLDQVATFADRGETL